MYHRSFQGLADHADMPQQPRRPVSLIMDRAPLRLFGMVGASILCIGAALVIDRLFFSVGLANRPALLLSSLLVVLGLQLFALGLLGELIIFTHARDLKDYQVDRVIEFPLTQKSV
jgi:hypothetical protein